MFLHVSYWLGSQSNGAQEIFPWRLTAALRLQRCFKNRLILTGEMKPGKQVSQLPGTDLGPCRKPDANPFPLFHERAEGVMPFTSFSQAFDNFPLIVYFDASFFQGLNEQGRFGVIYEHF
jgi:hypothetical protein